MNGLRGRGLSLLRDAKMGYAQLRRLAEEGFVGLDLAEVLV